MRLDKINCKIFFIHENNDRLIDYSHFQELLPNDEGNTGENKNIWILNPEITHNDNDIEKDIFNQIKVILVGVQSFFLEIVII